MEAMTNNVAVDERDVGFIENEVEVSNGMTVATFHYPDGTKLKLPMPVESGRWIAQQLARPSPSPFAHATADGVRVIILANMATVTFQGVGVAVKEIQTEVGKHCPLKQIGEKRR